MAFYIERNVIAIYEVCQGFLYLFSALQRQRVIDRGVPGVVGVPVNINCFT